MTEKTPQNENLPDSDSTGGPAFPRSGHEGETTFSNPQPGMTLRDYFAASAISGVWKCMDDDLMGDLAPVAAEYAYEIADAMLKERKYRGN